LRFTVEADKAAPSTHGNDATWPMRASLGRQPSDEPAEIQVREELLHRLDDNTARQRRRRLCTRRHDDSLNPHRFSRQRRPLPRVPQDQR
jgi:hypothetical protein